VIDQVRYEGDEPLHRSVDWENPVEANSIEEANSIDWIQRLASNSVQSVVTSPPYWGQRRYEDEQPVKWANGLSVAFGREQTVEEYVLHSLEILRYLKRVLRPDGTIWWVVGDTYQTRTVVRESTGER
jgi:DNA modification methylase